MTCQAIARQLFQAATRHFRERRMRRFAAVFGIHDGMRILDVGGTTATWQLLEVRPRVTILNMPRAQERSADRFEFVSGDGCQLPFPDRSFDIAFSNSVIEHVGSAENQRRFAEEVRRVGKGYWVQTPNRFFPIEQHLLTPVVHLLPRAWQRAIVPRWTVWDWLERPTPDRRDFYVEHYLNSIRLLGRRQLARLFPDARISPARWAGLSKSLLAWRLG
jgi:ubiquinone/menaquinone biosynthesis C-methylase UbiE